MSEFKDVEVIQVVRTTIGFRGRGTEQSVFRRLVQYWSLDGELLAEIDPCPDMPDGERLAKLVLLMKERIKMERNWSTESTQEYGAAKCEYAAAVVLQLLEMVGES